MRYRFLDSFHRLEHLGVELALVADRADQRALGAARNVDLEPVRPDLRLDGRHWWRPLLRPSPSL